jgi:hypothetical protein
MGEKKKSYRRWLELTQQVTAPRGRPSMGSAPTEAFPVRLDPELRQALDARAAASDTTPSEVVREALRRYLEVS